MNRAETWGLPRMLTLQITLVRLIVGPFSVLHVEMRVIGYLSARRRPEIVLLIDATNLEEEEREMAVDKQPNDGETEEFILADEGTILVIRRSCLTPRAIKED